MMGKMWMALAGAAAIVASAPANAVTTVATYSATTTLGTLTFTVAYDPAVRRFEDAPLAFSASLGASSIFSQPVSYNAVPVTRRLCMQICTDIQSTELTIGGSNFTPSNVAINDFRLRFDVDDGGFVSSPFGLQQAITLDANVNGVISSTPAFVALVAGSAVPEASTWAMMIVGLGVAGAGLRRRRRVTVAYA